MGNVTLSLIATSRHDKKLAMSMSGIRQKYSSRQHQQIFIEIENICQYVLVYYCITVQNIILSFSVFTPSFLTTQYMVDPPFALRTASTIEGISSYSFLTVSL